MQQKSLHLNSTIKNLIVLELFDAAFMNVKKGGKWQKSGDKRKKKGPW